jgi:hypothetical protein
MYVHQHMEGKKWNSIIWKVNRVIFVHCENEFDDRCLMFSIFLIQSFLLKTGNNC